MKVAAPLASSFTNPRDASRSYERTSGDDVYENKKEFNFDQKERRRDKSSLDYEVEYITFHRGTKLNILV